MGQRILSNQNQDGKRKDAPLILQFIKKLARYERLSHEVIATEKSF